MTARPAEETELRHRLIKCTLEVEASRSYWAHRGAASEANAKRAFDEFWFGARSLNRIGELLSSLRARFDAFPACIEVLHRWPAMSPDTRNNICHWHVQLAEPLYRRFTSDYLLSRHEGARAEVTHDLAVRWVVEQGGGRWAMSTCIQFASKLLSACYSAGLLGSKTDPRPVLFPRVGDDALGYLMYLLREISIEGTLLDNPYLASVGLEGPVLEDRLRRLPGLSFKRQGQLIDFGWHYPDLQAWSDARLGGRSRAGLGVAA
jgi:hypothetical protein